MGLCSGIPWWPDIFDHYRSQSSTGWERESIGHVDPGDSRISWAVVRHPQWRKGFSNHQGCEVIIGMKMWGFFTTAQLILDSPGSTWPILSLFHPVDWSLIMKRSSCSSEIIDKPVLLNTTFQCPPWNKKHLNYFCSRETRRSLLQKEK